MLIGYARVSTHEQTLNLQQDALTKAGCTKIFTGTIVVWKLGRLGTSIKELLNIMTDLSEQGIGFKSRTDNIDTTANGGKQVYKTFAALRNVLKAKTAAGLHVVRAKGRKGGRPKALTAAEIQELRELYSNQNIPILEIRRKFHLARSTFYRYVKPTDKKQPGLKGLVHRLRRLGE